MHKYVIIMVNGSKIDLSTERDFAYISKLDKGFIAGKNSFGEDILINIHNVTLIREIL